jgi:hypothetical protein
MAVVSAKHPDAPVAMPQAAWPRELAVQPVMDFDTDSCYGWPAIDKDGKTSPGLQGDGSGDPHQPWDPAKNCRRPEDLDNVNVYSRRRCNRGWCAYMYAYYFPKDAPSFYGGHRHDWEHVIVWTKSDSPANTVYQNERVMHVAVSAHGGYEVRAVKDVPMEGSHPKVVYHLSGLRTHSIRFAKSGEQPENHRKVWFRAPLVGWGGFPIDWSGQNGDEHDIKQKLLDADFGEAHLALKHGDFTRHLIDTLQKAPDAKQDGFDCAYDEEVPTYWG